MSLSLVDPAVAKSWEDAYAKGMDKRYPTLELVRLERWHFNGVPGRALEYGFGTGMNLIHLVECGHQVEGCEASQGAIKLVQQKLEQRAISPDQAHLNHVTPDQMRLPFEDNSFDYVTCLSVLSLLATRDRVSHMLSEFKRVLKPGGKAILDINGHTSEFASQGKDLGNDTYETIPNRDQLPVQTYCPAKVETFVELLEEHFVVDDIGHAGHKYMHTEIFEYIACVHKA